MCSARGTSWRGLKTTALQNHLPNKQQILILECLEFKALNEWKALSTCFRVWGGLKFWCEGAFMSV